MEEEPTESGLEPFEVRVSSWKYVTEFGVMALLFLFSLLLIGTGLLERDSGVLRDTLMTVFGLMVMPLSVLGCSNVLRFLRDSRPALQATEEGLLNRTLWSSTTLVPWEEVVDIRRTRRSQSLEVVLRDPEAYRERQTRTTRVLMRLRSLLGQDPFPLYLLQLDAPREEIARQLFEAVEAREIARIREMRLIEGPPGPESTT